MFELGITVSVGASWNKIFAKLGSDYKKPDAVKMCIRDRLKDLHHFPAAGLGEYDPSHI